MELASLSSPEVEDAEDAEEWEEMDEVEAIARAISQNIDSNIRHKPIRVPRFANPFADEPDLETRFLSGVDALRNTEAIPDGFNLHAHERELVAFFCSLRWCIADPSSATSFKRRLRCRSAPD